MPARSTDLQFVPVLTSFRHHTRLPQAPDDLTFGIRRVHSLAVAPGLTRSSGPVRSPSERSLGLPSPPGSPPLRCPGFGAVCLARPARVFDRHAGVAVDFRWDSRADRLRRACCRLRIVLAANQWIAETPSFVGPILSGASPHSVPLGSTFPPRRVPGAMVRPLLRRGESGESVETDHWRKLVLDLPPLGRPRHRRLCRRGRTFAPDS